MKINPTTYYGPDYWTGEKTYRDHDGTTKTYQGPALAWDGFNSIRDALFGATGTPSTLLDMCCGGGDFVRRCRQTGVNAKGIDISEYAVNQAGPDVREHLRICDALDPDVKIPQFDIVTAFDALEHFYVDDVGRFIQRCTTLATRYVVFCIGGADDPKAQFFAKKDEPVPPELEPAVVAGHVTIAPFRWWRNTIEDAAPLWELDYRAMTEIQVAFIEDPRFRDSVGRPLPAWGPNRVIVLSHA